MKKITKLLCLVLTLALLLPTFSVFAESGPTEVIFYFLGEELEDDKVVIEKINEKLIEKLNCYMSVQYVPFGEIGTTYPLLFASQTRMDAVFSAFFTGYASLAQKNAYMELTEDMLKTYAPITWEHQWQNLCRASGDDSEYSGYSRYPWRSERKVWSGSCYGCCFT